MMPRVPKWKKVLIHKMEKLEEKKRLEREARRMDKRNLDWSCKGCGMRMSWYRKKIKFINVALGLEFNFHNQECKIKWIHKFKKRQLDDGLEIL